MLAKLIVSVPEGQTFQQCIDKMQNVSRFHDVETVMFDYYTQSNITVVLSLIRCGLYYCPLLSMRSI